MWCLLFDILFVFFFFSSRRRHTRCLSDWSSDVCSSDLLDAADFDLSLAGFDQKEIDDLLLLPNDDEKENAAPPLPDRPVSRLDDLWLCGSPPYQHRILCA